MRKWLMLTIALVGLAVGGLLTASTHAQQTIPDWIKSNAGWWAEGKISDNEYAAALTYLVGQGIITVPEPEPTCDDMFKSYVMNTITYQTLKDAKLNNGEIYSNAGSEADRQNSLFIENKCTVSSGPNERILDFVASLKDKTSTHTSGQNGQSSQAEPAATTLNSLLKKLVKLTSGDTTDEQVNALNKEMQENWKAMGMQGRGAIFVISNTSWTGIIADGDLSMESKSGRGNAVYTAKCGFAGVQGNFQKEGESGGLGVIIATNGNIQTIKSTGAPFGIAYATAQC